MARILAVATNVDHYGEHDERTGLWLGELTHFLDIVQAAGHEVDLASPAGGRVPLDPRSLGRLFTTRADRALLEDDAFVRRLETTMALADVDADAYDCIYFTGGHGTMWDFPKDPHIAPLSTRIHARGGVVAAVCHGVGALLALEDTELVRGHEVTGYSDIEETLAGVAKLVPFSLEDELKRVGATYEKALLPFSSYVRTDRRLITGQNPQSTKAVAKATVAALANA